ncbi:DUF2218 domain-containing protein [Rhodopseudomonas sp. BR0M22]|uniref:DUF2218 domain-containing protein n=1 Tax=Rhodopseudomonas sp. BR0M22 TaxID=2269369 RepID=UPI0013DEA21D|nr:DUF2218 domain-containing protein [Rhodopseudomonas sp. BR0M22]NEW92912.1 DUF2218 domain-containing protein [Rhodopseudomonas sp. BR0M22]
MNSSPTSGSQTTHASVPTVHASRYLQQLCKHWSHKFETEFDLSQGRISLPLGEARLTATSDALMIDLTATNAANMTTFQEVVVSHIERFAFREQLCFVWE